MQYNYHTHTTRCQHAAGADRDYVEAAIRGGYKSLGFSDHVPYPFRDGHRSGMRMALEETAGYFESLLTLKEEYKDRIEIHIGFEAEYDPEGFANLKAFLSDYPCEYLIQGQHFIDVEHESIYSGAPTDSEKRLKAYADLLIGGMESGQFLYTAHPDLIHFTGPIQMYERYMRPVCRKARELNKPLEINLLGLSGGRNYPTEAFFRLAGEEGSPVVFGKQTHRAPQHAAKEREPDDPAVKMSRQCQVCPPPGVHVKIIGNMAQKDLVCPVVFPGA